LPFFGPPCTVRVAERRVGDVVASCRRRRPVVCIAQSHDIVADVIQWRQCADVQVRLYAEQCRRQRVGGPPIQLWSPI